MVRILDSVAQKFERQIKYSAWEISQTLNERQKLKDKIFGHEPKDHVAPSPLVRLNWLFLLFGLVGIVVTAVLPQQLQFSLCADAARIELLSTPKPIADLPATQIAGAILKA
jgi:hypothetical protein